MLDSALPRKTRSLKGDRRLSLPPRFHVVLLLSREGSRKVGAGQDAGADYLSAFEHPPSLDQGEGRAPPPRLGQLGLRLTA